MQLNIAKRTVSGILRPTNINLLPVLSDIEPPQECKKAHASTKEILSEPPNSHLISRQRFVIVAALLASLNQTVQETWAQTWSEMVPPGHDLVTN